MDGRRLKWNFAIALGVALALPAQAAECPREGRLGTLRVMTVDAATTPRVGYGSFRKTRDLCDREIVLTFDDGPVPVTDEKVLAAVEMALTGVPTTTTSAPFFRYPGFQMSQPSLDYLEKRGIVIFLLHDSEAQTAAALPALLRYLRDNRYRVVHVVAAAPGKPAADVRQSEKRE